MFTTISLLILISGCASNGPAIDIDSLPESFENQVTVLSSGYSTSANLNYLATFPANNQDSGPRSLIVFLHSLEERGDSLQLVFDNPDGEGPGLAKIAVEDPDFPFITLSPLCPDGTYWTFLHRRLGILIREFIQKENIHPNRVYLSGVSMGGMGTWSLATAQPELFAAIAPISGAVYTPPIRPRFRRIADIPAMVFHDTDDPSIPFVKAENSVQRFRNAGGTVVFVHNNTGMHYIHSEVYRSEQFIDWLGGISSD